MNNILSPTISIARHQSRRRNPLNSTQKLRTKNNYMKDTASSLQKKSNKYKGEENAINFTTSFHNTTNKNMKTIITQSVKKMINYNTQILCRQSYNWNEQNVSYNDKYNHFTDNSFGYDPYNHF